MNIGEQFLDEALQKEFTLSQRDRRGNMLPDTLPELQLNFMVGFTEEGPIYHLNANGYRCKSDTDRKVVAAEADKVAAMNMAQLDNYLKPLREAKNKATL